MVVVLTLVEECNDRISMEKVDGYAVLELERDIPLERLGVSR